MGEKKSCVYTTRRFRDRLFLGTSHKHFYFPQLSICAFLACFKKSISKTKEERFQHCLLCLFVLPFFSFSLFLVSFSVWSFLSSPIQCKPASLISLSVHSLVGLSTLSIIIMHRVVHEECCAYHTYGDDRAFHATPSSHSVVHTSRTAGGILRMANQTNRKIIDRSYLSSI